LLAAFWVQAIIIVAKNTNINKILIINLFSISYPF
jgi:hypothetical protein